MTAWCNISEECNLKTCCHENFWCDNKHVFQVGFNFTYYLSTVSQNTELSLGPYSSPLLFEDMVKHMPYSTLQPLWHLCSDIQCWILSHKVPLSAVIKHEIWWILDYFHQVHIYKTKFPKIHFNMSLFLQNVCYSFSDSNLQYILETLNCGHSERSSAIPRVLLS
jgi:hypothetical protein